MTSTFAALGVPEPIERALTSRGLTTPFPIQAATIPDGLAGHDICGKAPTGSGKTIAFGVPMVARVKRAAPKRPKGLVLAPTRELALQVAEELRSLGDQRVLAVYGGAGIEPQIKALRQGVDIVVACPGRLLDVIARKACDLRDVSFVVLDEADRMADMGFLPDVRRILDQTSSERQTVLFSATLDGAVETLVRRYQHDPVVHELEDEEAADITHHFWQAEKSERAQITADIVSRTGPTIVFSRTRHGADRIARQLERSGVSAAAIHGSRSQAQRERALTAFHRGQVQALVATDVAARGIHVEGVACVVHFDIPAEGKDYVHRSGRTARAGAAGTAVALVGADQRRDATKLARQAEVEVTLVRPDVNLLPEGPNRQPRRAPRPDGDHRSRGPAGGRAERTAPTPRTDAAASATAGPSKDRPSGAARRKAKRQAITASGGDPAAAARQRRRRRP